MSSKPNSLIELAATYEADFGLRVEKLPTDELEYVYEIMYAMAWELRGKANMVKDREGIIEMMRKRQEKERNEADDIARSLRAALADNNDTRQMQLNRAAELLTLIVGENMTHGQKNGAILLVVATLRKMSQDDLYLGDIPF